MQLARNVITAMTVIVASLSFSACAVQEETEVGADGTGVETDNGQTGQNISVENFNVSFDENSEYQVYWSKDADNDNEISASEFNTDCTATSGARTQCILDIDELDLWTHDVTINVELPGDAGTDLQCAYLRQRSYYFSRARVGEMPNHVYYSVDADGVVSGTKFCFPSGSCTYNSGTPSSSTGTYDPGDAPGLNRSAWITVDSEADVKCPWDYSALNSRWLSCCVGDYVKTVYGPDGVTDTETTWGGDLANCIAGPGVDDDLPKYADDPFDGFPASLITEVVGDGYGTEYVIPKRDRGGYAANLYFANYFKASDHVNSDESCSSLSDSEIDDGPSTCPLPISGGNSLSIQGTDFDSVMGYPYYTFECLDHNRDVVSRIDVMIREWNTKSQLLLGASGDPDVVGSESSPFSPQPKNDYCDWKDFGSDDAACGSYNYDNFTDGLFFMSYTFAEGE